MVPMCTIGMEGPMCTIGMHGWIWSPCVQQGCMCTMGSKDRVQEGGREGGREGGGREGGREGGSEGGREGGRKGGGMY